MAVFLAFISSFFISLALIPPLIKSAGWFQMMDLPGERKMHAVPIARVGGIAFAIGSFASILIWNPADPVLVSYLLGSLVILIFGVWDDWANLSFKKKFLAQILAAGIVVVYGKVRVTAFPFLDGVSLSAWFTIPFTMVALLGITNAINLSDGLDGLAGGLSLLSFSGLAFLAWLSGDNSVLGMVIPILGGIFGFLRFNTYPATVFMGDGGSQFLGFSLGVFSFVLTDSVRGPYTPLIALLLVGLPVLDTLGVMIQRWRAGQSLFMADRNHIHHKLISAGFFHYEVVILIYLFQILLVFLACLLRFQDDLLLTGVYGGLALIFYILFFRAGKPPLSWKKGTRSCYPDLFIRLKSNRWMAKFPLQLLGIIIPVFMAGIVFIPQKIPVDFGSFAFALLLIFMGALFFRKGIPILVRLTLYVGGAFGVYLSEQTLSLMPFFPFSLFNLFYVLLACLVILTIWTNNKKELFHLTPLDFLILSVVLAVSLIMKIEVGGAIFGLLAAKLIILFYAFEILLNQFSNRLGVLSGISIWTLVVMGLRGWIS